MQIVVIYYQGIFANPALISISGFTVKNAGDLQLPLNPLADHIMVLSKLGNQAF